MMLILLNDFRKLLLIGLGLGALIFAEGVVASPIYVYRDEGGAVYFSSRKPPTGVEAKVFTAKNSKYSRYRMTPGGGRTARRGRLNTELYSAIIRGAAQHYQLSPALIRAVIHAESSFNSRAVSPKGALGLMQLMPANVKRLGVKDPFCPQQNIYGGTRMLNELRHKYRGNLTLMLAAYNAGEGAVQKYRGVPPFPETQHYVRVVQDLLVRYRAAL